MTLVELLEVVVVEVRLEDQFVPTTAPMPSWGVAETVRLSDLDARAVRSMPRLIVTPPVDCEGKPRGCGNGAASPL